MRVPMFEFDGWTCDFQPRKGHVFQRSRDRIVVRRGGFPGQLFVQRSWADRTFNLSIPPYGPTNGGEQGGWGIVLMPQWSPSTRANMDGTIARHPLGFFNDDGTPWRGDGKRYPLMATPLPNGYQKHDGAHYIRAFSDAVALWAHERDPVARMHLALCAYDVIRRFPLVSFVDGDGPEYSLASMEKNVALFPHQGALGIVRELAWSLRAVVEAQRAAPCDLFRNWIKRFVAMVYLGQAENGAIERHTYGQGLDQEEPVLKYGLDPKCEWCTSWQVPFFVRALREAARVVPECYTHTRTIMSRIKPWTVNVPFAEGEDNSWPWLPLYLVIGESGNLYPTITRGVGKARPYYAADMDQCFAEMEL